MSYSRRNQTSIGKYIWLLFKTWQKRHVHIHLRLGGERRENQEFRFQEGNEKNPFPKFGNGKGMKKIHSRNSGRESEASILGNDREREFPLTPEPGFTITIVIALLIQLAWHLYEYMEDLKGDLSWGKVLEQLRCYRGLALTISWSWYWFQSLTSCQTPSISLQNQRQVPSCLLRIPNCSEWQWLSVARPRFLSLLGLA